jgi:autotransporter translocation and assembly factor TamB
MSTENPASAIARPARRWIRTLLLGVIIFVSGALVGGGLTFKVIATEFKRFFQEPEALAESITHRMKKKLDLTDDQAVQVRRILLERHKAFQALRKEVQPRWKAEIESTRRKMAAVLTAEQARKWEKGFRRFSKFWLPSPSGQYAPDP